MVAFAVLSAKSDSPETSTPAATLDTSEPVNVVVKSEPEKEVAVAEYQCWSSVGRGTCMPTKNGEDTCEGHGFSPEQCESIGCCHYNWDYNYCFSSVGRDICAYGDTDGSLRHGEQVCEEHGFSKN